MEKKHTASDNDGEPSRLNNGTSKTFRETWNQDKQNDTK